MRTKQTTSPNIDAYIAGFPNEVQKILEKNSFQLDQQNCEIKESDDAESKQNTNQPGGR